MKTILRIIIILLAAVIVSGALYLTIENTSVISDASGFPEGGSEFGERPEMPADDVSNLPERSDGGGDHHAASLSRGLSGVGIALAKITGITLFVLLAQGLFTQLKRCWPAKPSFA